ncbi:MAG: hypothetical protein HYX82_01410 [Chloroflexi bacterium]|nr:hypothetical protein [Chloroflexota bacterium]
MANRYIWPVFWALLVVFAVPIFDIMVGPLLYRRVLGPPPQLFLLLWGAVFLLGLVLLILTLRATIDKTLKKFLLLTSSSSVAIFVSILLHGLVYGLFILLFGEDFWERIGIGDEPFFFLIAVFVCPIAFLVGAVGSIVLRIRRGKQEIQAV